MKRPPQAPSPALARIDILVRLPAPLPPGGAIFIAGNRPELGDWDPGRVPLEPRTDGKQGLSLSVPRGEVIEFKLTRGNWKSQALYAGRKERFPPDNRRIKVFRSAVVELTVTDWLDALPVPVDPVRGDLRVHAGFRCPGLRHDRDILVWLPPSYSRHRRRYPVLYMHDGQNLFDPAQSFCGQDWQVDETAQKMMQRGEIEEFIVVGIPNSPDRMEELNLFRPLGKRYARFLIETLKPFIDGFYRTRPDPEHTAVMGSSMGGLMSFQLAWFHADVFTRAGCLSSAFWVSRERIFSAVRATAFPNPPVKIYLDTGEFEPPIRAACTKMVGLLLERGFRPHLDLMTRMEPGATHCERAWAERLPIAFGFLFPPRTPHP